jgi:hypothetical protein
MDHINYEDLPEGLQGGQLDHPFDDCAVGAEEVVKRGGTIFQKFSCRGCGNRLTMDVPNKFFTEGSCDQCGVVTNIRETGCNFLAVFPLTEKGKESVETLSP